MRRIRGTSVRPTSAPASRFLVAALTAKSGPCWDCPGLDGARRRSAVGNSRAVHPDFRRDTDLVPTVLDVSHSKTMADRDGDPMPAVAGVRRLSRTAHQLPIGSQIGLAVMVLGFAADLVAHLDPALDHDHGGMTGPQLSAHLVVFVGMALVLIGVVIDGVRSGRRSGGRATQGR